MAKWGEGDERWIVENRADGANVNNWHWTEKNVTKIAEQRLQESCNTHECPNGCRFTKVDKFSGFVNVCNRKGKINVQYTLDVTLKWKREVAGEDEDDTMKASGSVMMEEIFDDDPDMEIKVDKKSASGATPDRATKDMLQEHAKTLVVSLIKGLKTSAEDGTLNLSPQKSANQ